MDLYGFTLPFIRCVVSPAGATHFQKSDFSEPFFRCVVSPAGATHFQKSDFFRALFYPRIYPDNQVITPGARGREVPSLS